MPAYKYLPLSERFELIVEGFRGNIEIFDIDNCRVFFHLFNETMESLSLSQSQFINIGTKNSKERAGFYLAFMNISNIARGNGNHLLDDEAMLEKITKSVESFSVNLNDYLSGLDIDIKKGEIVEDSNYDIIFYKKWSQDVQKEASVVAKSQEEAYSIAIKADEELEGSDKYEGLFDLEYSVKPQDQRNKEVSVAKEISDAFGKQGSYGFYQSGDERWEIDFEYAYQGSDKIMKFNNEPHIFWGNVIGDLKQGEFKKENLKLSVCKSLMAQDGEETSVFDKKFILCDEKELFEGLAPTYLKEAVAIMNAETDCEDRIVVADDREHTHLMQAINWENYTDEDSGEPWSVESVLYNKIDSSVETEDEDEIEDVIEVINLYLKASGQSEIADTENYGDFIDYFDYMAQNEFVKIDDFKKLEKTLPLKLAEWEPSNEEVRDTLAEMAKRADEMSAKSGLKLG
ncbi:MAG: hypothetical protein PHO62_08025 [Sulfurimonas sp.]|uniref:hypothetical protein n=1 Tax=Sulfurimonas sp. TaxID=2022749 RepID=UPI0026247AD4|nr:hypothetical protein [Sulfurimonas sp.]MDD5373355.1 hypothetical protein [Sulfurimonas sp.]